MNLFKKDEDKINEIKFIQFERSKIEINHSSIYSILQNKFWVLIFFMQIK